MSSSAAGRMKATTPSPRASRTSRELIPRSWSARAHAGCYLDGAGELAGPGGLRGNSIHTTADVHLGKDDKGFLITRIDLTVVGDVPNLDDATFQDHAEKAKTGCIVSRALAATPDDAQGDAEEVGSVARRARTLRRRVRLRRSWGSSPASPFAFLAAPPGFAALLAPLPDGVSLSAARRLRTISSSRSFVTPASCDVRLAELGPAIDRQTLWLAWPKQAAKVPTDLNGNIVRETGLAAGWVDYKVCAIDPTWSGLAFKKRR